MKEKAKAPSRLSPCFRRVAPKIQTYHPYIHPLFSNGNIFLPNNSKGTSSEK